MAAEQKHIWAGSALTGFIGVFAIACSHVRTLFKKMSTNSIRVWFWYLFCSWLFEEKYFQGLYVQL